MLELVLSCFLLLGAGGARLHFLSFHTENPCPILSLAILVFFLHFLQWVEDFLCFWGQWFVLKTTLFIYIDSGADFLITLQTGGLLQVSNPAHVKQLSELTSALPQKEGGVQQQQRVKCHQPLKKLDTFQPIYPSSQSRRQSSQ